MPTTKKKQQRITGHFVLRSRHKQIFCHDEKYHKISRKIVRFLTLLMIIFNKYQWIKIEL